jgi:hypothetical protein
VTISSPLRRFSIAIGLAWAAAFIAVGLVCELQLYGDGSIFSYAVASDASWDFHWRNIAARLFVHVFSHLPAELYVAATGDPRGGVAIYGALFFAGPLFGLVLTFVADRSPRRHLFAWACLSTSILCPLVFGCPTELWLAHAVFWPTLALCHYAPANRIGAVLIGAAFITLVLTHEGALIFAFAIVATAALRGMRSFVFSRACVALALAGTVWIAIKFSLPPDDYIAPVLARASRYVIDIGNFTRRIILLIAAALGAYIVVDAAMRKIAASAAPFVAGLLVAVALAIYWLTFDDALHAQDRYIVRTVLLAVTPLFGMLAVSSALTTERHIHGLAARLQPITGRILAMPARSIIAALLLVALVHGVETAKFVTAWMQYKSAIRTLATGAASDPVLGDVHFVSSQRISADLDRLGWNSTTPYLSVMVAPGLRPSRLVVDPAANYFWLSCATATANETAPRALPADSRRLVRMHACLHR